jgi:hypothetical protein
MTARPRAAIGCATLLPPAEAPYDGSHRRAAPKGCEGRNTGGQERRRRWYWRGKRGSARQKRDREHSECKTERLHGFTLLFQQDHFSGMIKTLSK